MRHQHARRRPAIRGGRGRRPVGARAGFGLVAGVVGLLGVFGMAGTVGVAVAAVAPAAFAAGAPGEVVPDPTAPADPDAPADPAAPVDPAPPADPAPAEPGPATPATPQLSITVTDEQDAAAPGDDLTYTIVVTNLGTSDALDLTVTQTVPEGLTFTSADNGGAFDASAVSWTTAVKAAESVTFSTTMAVGETPAELLRLATVACALTAPTDPPVVCASDSDILPAGAAAEQAAADASGAPSELTPWLIGGAIALVVLAAVVVAVLTRRRTSSRHRAN